MGVIMRFMIEEGILIVWLDEKDWLELSAETGLDLAPDQQFATTYVSHRKAVQEAIIRLAERHCPVEDQDAVRQASEQLATSQPIASIMAMSEQPPGRASPGFVQILNITTPND
jgi:hypothetical protein